MRVNISYQNPSGSTIQDDFTEVNSSGTVAIPPSTNNAFYLVTKAGVQAMTLAAPVSVIDDGKRITVQSNTANAHTLTATGLFNTGSASVNLATFAAFAGAGVVLEAVRGKWNVISATGITFS